ncbi:response regulator [Radicibacter daui]|uniref:response regulator n=1 Tax=Radicibacter daui TaxID=3064829 RepID=UPI004046FCF7
MQPLLDACVSLWPANLGGSAVAARFPLPLALVGPDGEAMAVNAEFCRLIPGALQMMDVLGLGELFTAPLAASLLANGRIYGQPAGACHEGYAYWSLLEIGSGNFLLAGHPLADPDTRTAEALDQLTASLDPAGTPEPRVLVVEDNHLTQVMMRAVLTRKAGVRLDVVGDRDAAVTACRMASYALIFMDLHLHGADGCRITDEILSAQPHDPPAIIGLSGDASPEARGRALAAGMSDYLVKPVEPLDLLEITRRFLKRGQLQPN